MSENENKDKKQFDVNPEKFRDDPQYRDIKPAEQSADNDEDRFMEGTGKEKEETDKAYLKQGNKSGISGTKQE